MRSVQPSWALTPEGVVQDPIITWDDGLIVGCSGGGRHPGVHHQGDLSVEKLPGRLLLPGLVNAHSHAFQRAIRGHVQWRDAERGDFWSWRQAMYRAANAMDPDAFEAVSRLAFLEMAESGITEVAEFHYVHHQTGGSPYDDPDELARRVIRAALDVGIRICLLRVAYHRGGPGIELAPEQARFRADSPDEVLTAIQRLGTVADPRVRVGLAPHSVRAVPPEWLPEFATFSGPIHAHVAEQPAEVAACVAETGLSPLALLARAGLVHERFGAVHLTFPSAGDVDLMASAGATAVVCPSTELDLGDGLLPVDARQRLHLAVGSDSHAMIDLFQEVRTLELHGRALAGRRHILTPDDDDHGLAGRLLAAATADGARCLGREGGQLIPGSPADFVTLDLRRPAAAGVPPLEAAALVADSSWVDDVWVAGRLVVRGGRHPNRARIVEEASSVIRTLFS
ncbi:MAG: formimidoylglutamate deiminase [Myxococcota bacterium]